MPFIDNRGRCKNNVVMDIRTSMKNNWAYAAFPERIDAFNFQELKQALCDISRGSKLVAFDFSVTRFVSLPAIKHLHVLASDIVKSGGRVVLLAPTEKIKRQIDIFASIEPMTVFPTIDSWEVSNGWKKDTRKVVKVATVEAAL